MWYTNFSFGMVIQPNNRIGLAVIRTWPRGYHVFCRPYCVLLTQQFLPKKGSKWLFFLKNCSQIRILHPKIDLFHDLGRILIFSNFLMPKLDQFAFCKIYVVTRDQAHGLGNPILLCWTIYLCSYLRLFFLPKHPLPLYADGRWHRRIPTKG